VIGRAAAVALLATLALAACQAKEVAQPAPEVVAVLQVIVQDEQERAVPGAEVVADNPTEAITTDRNGIALLPVYAPVVRLAVRLRGYQDTIVESVPVAAGAIVRVTLKPR
jgi:hypothetical protein